MMKLAYLSVATALAISLTACQTSQPALLTPVPRVALATSRYQEVFNLERKVVTEFKSDEEIAISVYIPRGGGYGERPGTLLVRSASDGRIVRREQLPLKEDDYVALKQDNPGPGKYNIEFIADNGVLATTWFVVQ